MPLIATLLLFTFTSGLERSATGDAIGVNGHGNSYGLYGTSGIYGAFGSGGTSEGWAMRGPDRRGIPVINPS